MLRSRSHATESLDELGEQPASLELAQDPQASLWEVGEALDRLPGDQRQALYLTACEGYRANEVAKMMGVPIWRRRPACGGRRPQSVPGARCVRRLPPSRRGRVVQGHVPPRPPGSRCRHGRRPRPGPRSRCRQWTWAGKGPGNGSPRPPNPAMVQASVPVADKARATSAIRATPPPARPPARARMPQHEARGADVQMDRAVPRALNIAPRFACF